MVVKYKLEATMLFALFLRGSEGRPSLRILLIGFVLLLFPVAITSGQQDHFPDISTTAGFLEMCSTLEKQVTQQSEIEIMKRGYCLGWMNGLTAGIHTSEAIHHDENEIFCSPEGNSFGQMVRVIKKYIADHPEHEHLLTELLAAKALQQAFPCTR